MLYHVLLVKNKHGRIKSCTQKEMFLGVLGCFCWSAGLKGSLFRGAQVNMSLYYFIMCGVAYCIVLMFLNAHGLLKLAWLLPKWSFISWDPYFLFFFRNPSDAKKKITLWRHYHCHFPLNLFIFKIELNILKERL